MDNKYPKIIANNNITSNNIPAINANISLSDYYNILHHTHNINSILNITDDCKNIDLTDINITAEYCNSLFKSISLGLNNNSIDISKINFIINEISSIINILKLNNKEYNTKVEDIISKHSNNKNIIENIDSKINSFTSNIDTIQSKMDELSSIDINAIKISLETYNGILDTLQNTLDSIKCKEDLDKLDSSLSSVEETLSETNIEIEKYNTNASEDSVSARTLEFKNGVDGLLDHISAITLPNIEDIQFVADTYNETIQAIYDANKNIVPFVNSDNKWVVNGETTDILGNTEDVNLSSKEDENKQVISINGNNITIDLSDHYHPANLNALLAKDNETYYRPVSDYNPATRDYVDLKKRYISNLNILSKDGLYDTRFYNNKLQTLNPETNTWEDVEVYNQVIDYNPKPLELFNAVYDKSTDLVKIKFIIPEDVSITSDTVDTIERIIIIRGKDSIPEYIEGSTVVLDLLRKDFNSYNDKYFTDDFDGDGVYYYRAIILSKFGFYNKDSIARVEKKDYELYGFRIDQTEPNCDNMISYLADNENFVNAYMDFQNNKFELSDWKNAWFVKNLKACVLDSEGSVAYYVNNNDFTKKLDGSNADSNEVFIEIPSVFIKVDTISDDITEVYFSNKKLSDEFTNYPFIDKNGNVVDCIYLSAHSHNVSEIDTNDIASYNVRVLLTYLTMLIGKTTDVCSLFGNVSPETEFISGSLDKNGLFFGSNTGVKLFGIENIFGAQPKYFNNINISDNGSMQYKTSDDVDYIDSNISLVFNNSLEPLFISKILFSDKYILPIESNGTSSTYYCDSITCDDNAFADLAFGSNGTNDAGLFTMCKKNIDTLHAYILHRPLIK